jgi:hypothetical protein
MAKRQNKSWSPSWRLEQERGARAVQHQFSRIVNSAQQGANAWTVEQAAMYVAEVKASVEEAEAVLQRYQEREAA